MKNGTFLGLQGTALGLFSGCQRTHYPDDVIQGRGSGSAGYWTQTWEPKMGDSYRTTDSSH